MELKQYQENKKVWNKKWTREDLKQEYNRSFDKKFEQQWTELVDKKHCVFISEENFFDHLLINSLIYFEPAMVMNEINWKKLNSQQNKEKVLNDLWLIDGDEIQIFGRTPDYEDCMILRKSGSLFEFNQKTINELINKYCDIIKHDDKNLKSFQHNGLIITGGQNQTFKRNYLELDLSNVKRVNELKQDIEKLFKNKNSI